MRKHNGTQLYGLQRLLTTLKMGMHSELANLSLKQKLALNYISKEHKLTHLSGKIFSNTFTPYYPSKAYDRFLNGAVATALGTPRPVITNFAVTARCVCNCWHCSFSNRELKDGLNLDDLKKNISAVQDLGVSVIGLTGGEPLLRKDLEEIISAIDERSMPIMFTTGYGLTRERVKALKQAGLEIPVLSLDHYTAEWHDKGRGKEGIFNGTLKAIELFQEEGFYTAVSFVPTKELVDNEKELFKTLDFFKEIGINDIRLTSPILSGQLVCKPEEKLTPENVKTIFQLRKKAKNKRGYPNIFAYDFFESGEYYGCGAGYNYMFIDSQGNVSPCDFTMLSLGNIKKEPVAAIWKRMSNHFCGPSCSCYANVIHDNLYQRNIKQWPVPEQLAEEVLKELPPFDEKNVPLFYQKIGFKKNSGNL